MRIELAAAKRFLETLAPEGGPVLCAVSGGLDSMCLLHLLADWGQDAGFRVTAAHFNHQLRDNAGRDETFVRAYCAARGIPFVSGRGDTRALAARGGRSLEEAARILRYAFLEETAAKAGCRWICTAHHADDNAETMLLNLIRGTGSAGLAGIPPVRGAFCRPLLSDSRAELALYAAAHGVPHVEDETNETDDAARNVLRHQVLPVLRTLNPQSVANMTRAAGILARENDALEALAAELAGQARETPGDLTLPCALLAQAPEAVAERAILHLLAQAAGHRQDLTAAHVASVLRLAQSRQTEGTVSLPEGLMAWRGRYALHITPAAPPPGDQAITFGETVAFGEWCVTLGEQPGGDCAYALTLPEGAGLTVTVWQSGDRMTLPAARGGRSLKRLCADAGIIPRTRDALPVLRVDGRPAAVPGVGIHSDFTPRSTEKTVWITFLKLTEEKKHEK